MVKHSYIYGIIILLAVVVALLILLVWPQSTVSSVALGQCLADNDVVMYGVDTCPNCRDQKQVLGDDFADIDYVNCDFERELCHEKGVRSYPAWVRGDKKLIGLQSRKTLALFGDCGDSISSANAASL